MEKDDRPCTEGGQRHRVNEDELQEARSLDEGGVVHCLDCGKGIEQGPLNLEFRATLASE